VCVCARLRVRIRVRARIRTFVANLANALPEYLMAKARSSCIGSRSFDPPGRTKLPPAFFAFCTQRASSSGLACAIRSRKH